MRVWARIAIFLSASLTLCLVWDASLAPQIEISLSGTAVAFLMAFVVVPVLICAGVGLVTGLFRPWHSTVALFAITACLLLPWAAFFAILALDCLLSTDCA
jgi:hypothetical protein